MKQKHGFVALVDKAGNKISVAESKAAQLIKAGYRRADDPPAKPKARPEAGN